MEKHGKSHDTHEKEAKPKEKEPEFRDSLGQENPAFNFEKKLNEEAHKKAQEQEKESEKEEKNEKSGKSK